MKKIFNNSIEYLNDLMGMLLTERDEERKRYKEFTENIPFSERKKKGYIIHPLIFLDSEYFMHSSWKIKFSFDSKTEPAIQNGNQVTVYLKDNSDEKIFGTVSRRKDKTIEIIANCEEIPDFIEENGVCIELHYDERVYEEMKNSIENSINAEKGTRLFELREIITGFEKPNFSDTKEIFYSQNINESQNLAVNKILQAKDTYLILGPPGTGKTTLITEVIDELIKKEEKILIAAPSNAAVDLLVKKLAEKGLTPLRIGNPARVEEDNLIFTLEYNLKNNPETKTLSTYKKEAEELFRKANKYKRVFDKAAREERTSLRKEAKEILKYVNKAQKQLIETTVEKAKIIASTVSGIRNAAIKNTKFSTIIVDEATQMIEPGIWMLLTNLEGRLILAGDDKQLPPTVKSESAIKKGLLISLFERLLENNHESHLLNMQYRTSKKLFEFSNQNFYESKVLSYKTGDYTIFESEIGNGLVFIDTAGSDSEEKFLPESESLKNDTEVELTLKIFDILKDKIITSNEKYNIGIISPYKAQVYQLKESFQKKEIPVNIDLDIDTIDSFQGSERDIIIISLVRSNDLGEIGFLKDYRRMNVALTRAIKTIIILGDSSTITLDSFYERLFDYARDYGTYKTIWEFL